MAQRKILLDTNSYLRLAYTIHPLLFQEFGSDSCCLYVLKELDDELKASHRLQTKFAWASQEEYVANRRHQLTTSRKQKVEIENAISFIWDHVQAEHPGPSRIDVRHLAYGFVLQVPVVSDDRDLLAVARTFDIEVMKSIEPLKLMLDCGHISVQKLDTVMSSATEMPRFWIHPRMEGPPRRGPFERKILSLEFFPGTRPFACGTTVWPAGPSRTTLFSLSGFPNSSA